MPEGYSAGHLSDIEGYSADDLSVEERRTDVNATEENSGSKFNCGSKSLWTAEGYSAGPPSDTEGYSAGDLNVEGYSADVNVQSCCKANSGSKSLWTAEGYSAGPPSDTEGYSAGDLSVEEKRTDVNVLKFYNVELLKKFVKEVNDIVIFMESPFMISSVDVPEVPVSIKTESTGSPSRFNQVGVKTLREHSVLVVAGESSMSFRPLAHEVFCILFSYLFDSKLMDPPHEKPLAIALDFSTRFAVPSRSSGLVVKAQSWKVDEAPDSQVAPLVQGQCLSVSPYARSGKEVLGIFLVRVLNGAPIKQAMVKILAEGNSGSSSLWTTEGYSAGPLSDIEGYSADDLSVEGCSADVNATEDNSGSILLWKSEGYSAGLLSDTEGYSAGDLSVEERRTDVNLKILRAYLDLASDHEPYSSCCIRSIVANPVDSPDPHSTKNIIVTLENSLEVREEDSLNTPGMSLGTLTKSTKVPFIDFEEPLPRTAARVCNYLSLLPSQPLRGDSDDYSTTSGSNTTLFSAEGTGVSFMSAELSAESSFSSGSNVTTAAEGTEVSAISGSCIRMPAEGAGVASESTTQPALVSSVNFISGITQPTPRPRGRFTMDTESDTHKTGQPLQLGVFRSKIESASVVGPAEGRCPPQTTTTPKGPLTCEDFEANQKSPVPIGARVAAWYGPNGCKHESRDESAPAANAGTDVQRDNGCRQAQKLMTNSVGDTNNTNPIIAAPSTLNRQVRIRGDSAKDSDSSEASETTPVWDTDLEEQFEQNLGEDSEIESDQNEEDEDDVLPEPVPECLIKGVINLIRTIGEVTETASNKPENYNSYESAPTKAELTKLLKGLYPVNFNGIGPYVDIDLLLEARATLSYAEHCLRGEDPQVWHGERWCGLIADQGEVCPKCTKFHDPSKSIGFYEPSESCFHAPTTTQHYGRWSYKQVYTNRFFTLQPSGYMSRKILTCYLVDNEAIQCNALDKIRLVLRHVPQLLKYNHVGVRNSTTQFELISDFAENCIKNKSPWLRIRWRGAINKLCAPIRSYVHCYEQSWEIGRPTTPIEKTMPEEPWEEPKEPPQNCSEELKLEDDVFSEGTDIVWRSQENTGIRRKLVESTHPLGTARMRRENPGCEQEDYGYQPRGNNDVSEECPDSPPQKRPTLKELTAHEIQIFQPEPVAKHEQDDSDPLVRFPELKYYCSKIWEGLKKAGFRYLANSNHGRPNQCYILI